MRVFSVGLSLLLAVAALPAILSPATATAPADRPQPYVLLAQSDIGSEVEGELDSDEGAEDSAYPENFVFPRIPVTFPASADAPGLTEFLASLRSAVEKRDDAALVASIAPKIFWDRDFGGGFDEAASGVENFRQAFQIGIPDILPEYADDGWTRLSQTLATGRFSTDAEHPGAVCTPVAPTLADAAAAAATFAKVNMADDEWQLYWGFVDGKAEARQEGKADAPVIGTVDNEAVPVHVWDFDKTGFVEIGLPDGKHGFVNAAQVGSWVDERVCLGQTDGKWSIVGYIGGGD